MVLIGDDFAFQNAYYGFTAIDTLVKRCNEMHGKEANLEYIYSTPSGFFDALKEENVRFSVYKGDLFPYEDRDQRYHFWSGIYTSRPAYKKQVRDAS